MSLKQSVSTMNGLFGVAAVFDVRGARPGPPHTAQRRCERHGSPLGPPGHCSEAEGIHTLHLRLSPLRLELLLFPTTTRPTADFLWGPKETPAQWSQHGRVQPAAGLPTPAPGRGKLLTGGTRCGDRRGYTAAETGDA